MATGGYDRNVDSRVTCSICLEPYKGRQPKLLPCSHTFCLPCLTQIADKEAASPKFIRVEEDDRVVTITCPTCRTPVPLPPGGVAKLHNNIYVDEDHAAPVHPQSSTPQRINCDLCEEGQEAKFTCSGCRACFCARCRRMHDKICKSSQVTEIKVQAADDGDKETDVKGLASAVEKMMKRMSELEKTVATQQTLIAGLQSHVTGLQNQNTMLHDKNTQQEKQSKRERDALEKELISVKDKNAILCQDNQELHNDVSKLQDSVAETNDKIDKISNMQDDFHGRVTKLQTEQDKLQKDSLAKKDILDLKRQSEMNMQDLRDMYGRDLKDMKDKFSRHVAFHAIKNFTVKLKQNQTVICDQVISNVGSGYNRVTGVFKAPVSGMYCFIASSSASSQDTDELSKLDIVMNETVIAYLCASGNASSTAHAVVSMKAGEVTKLKVNENGPFAGGWKTSFTGVLVQSDL